MLLKLYLTVGISKMGEMTLYIESCFFMILLNCVIHLTLRTPNSVGAFFYECGINKGGGDNNIHYVVSSLLYSPRLNKFLVSSPILLYKKIKAAK